LTLYCNLPSPDAYPLIAYSRLICNNKKPEDAVLIHSRWTMPRSSSWDTEFPTCSTGDPTGDLLENKMPPDFRVDHMNMGFIDLVVENWRHLILGEKKDQKPPLNHVETI